MAAMFLFEKEHGNELDQRSIRQIEKEGLFNTNPLDILGEIKDFLETATIDDPLLGTAIFALGKRYDANLKKLFIGLLHRTLDGNPHALFQTLVALDNLGENVLQGGGCVNEIERNRRLAEDYLKMVA